MHYARTDLKNPGVPGLATEAAGPADSAYDAAMRWLALATMLALLSFCGGSPSIPRVFDENGEPWLRIACRKPSQCIDQLSNRCRCGYVVKDDVSPRVAAQDGYVLFRCRVCD
jgi:hypothetical protein